MTMPENGSLPGRAWGGGVIYHIYFCYFCARDGKRLALDDFDAHSDVNAIERARLRALRVPAFEVWQGERLVYHTTPEPHAAAPVIATVR